MARPCQHPCQASSRVSRPRIGSSFFGVLSLVHWRLTSHSCGLKVSRRRPHTVTGKFEEPLPRSRVLRMRHHACGSRPFCSIREDGQPRRLRIRRSLLAMIAGAQLVMIKATRLWATLPKASLLSSASLMRATSNARAKILTAVLELLYAGTGRVAPHRRRQDQPPNRRGWVISANTVQTTSQASLLRQTFRTALGGDLRPA